MSRYTVKLSYHDFGFDDANTAIGFAGLAREHFVPSEHNSSMTVVITVNEIDKEETNDNDK